MAVISELDPNQPSVDGLAGQGDDFLRLIQDALITCFGGVDGPVNSGTGNPLATANELTSLFDRLSAIEGAAGGGIVGEIRSYYGTYESIPAGWSVCDGSNGTPDLQGRFLVGADNNTGMPTYQTTSTGGAVGGEGVTGAAGAHLHSTSGTSLTMANMPTDMSANLQTLWTSGGDGITHQDNASMAQGEGTPEWTTLPVKINGATGAAHTHGDTGSVGDHTHTLGASSLPPWNAIYYIMYTG